MLLCKALKKKNSKDEMAKSQLKYLQIHMNGVHALTLCVISSLFSG